MIRFLILYTFLLTVNTTKIFGQADSILPTGLMSTTDSDWTIFENQMEHSYWDIMGIKAPDSIKLDKKTILIYFKPCSFIFLDTDNKAHNEPAILFVVESGQKTFKKIELPQIPVDICYDGQQLGVGISHKQINGKGLPEIIIDWNFSSCGSAICLYFGGTYIIDIENEESLLNILTYKGEEVFGGKYGGKNSSSGCRRSVQTDNKKIIISNLDCGEIDKEELANTFLDIDKEFSESAGTYKWKNNKFIKVK